MAISSSFVSKALTSSGRWFDGWSASSSKWAAVGLTPDEAVAMLSSDSELPARLTAPASGLFLERVRYEGDPGPNSRSGGCRPWELELGVGS